MTRPLALVALSLCGACRTSPPTPQAPAATALTWSQVATDDGEIAIPMGWSMRVSRNPDPIFDLYSRDADLAVFVFVVTEHARLYAACAVEYAGPTPVAVVAIASRWTASSVSAPRYRQAGGRAMLCGIAMSARRLRLARR